MFSPSARDGGPATATRSRRRQRPLSQENIVQQPKAKRQRLPLTEQTFVNPEVPQQQHQQQNPDSIEVRPGRAPATELATDNNENHHNTPPRKDLNVRASKKTKHGDRAANKGDGSIVLTSTNAYTASKLPALPDKVRSDWTATQHAEIFSSFGYALTLTSTHAIVWPYTSTAQSPETFPFTLPSSNKSTDPLPVGCLVSPSAASTEPGLVVVMAGGKVVYWESISSAATFAFIKNGHSGIEYAISGMSSGEKVCGITNAESAGFILTFNTGRLAYMNVRDNHGRPAISVQFLRTNLPNPAGGIFGSIRHAFSHLSLRGDVAAVRADRSARIGERNIVAMGAKARLQAWRIHRGGHHEAIGEFDAREDIVSAIYEQDVASQDYPVESFEALDFAFVPKRLESKYSNQSRFSDAIESDDSSVQHLLLLVSLTKMSRSRYCLVEGILTADSFKTGMIRPITSYSSVVQKSDVSQTPAPRLYLPRPALVAFLVFDRAAVIASVAGPPESPDAQLQTDNHVLPASYEDVIDFREDEVHRIIGSGFEELPPVASSHEEPRIQRQKVKNPAAVLLVRGAGVVRLVTNDIDKFASDQPPVVSAKSKLEQAVFFGTKQNNPLVFGKRQEVRFSDEEIAAAALEISNEILRSTTSYISTLPAHMEENLRARSAALERLITQVNLIGANLDRRTRWELLHDAEKMHVACQLWKLQETMTSSRQSEDKKTIIGSIVEFIHEDHKKKAKKEIGEIDPVRHWFINDIYRLELFVAWAYEAVKVTYKDRLADESKFALILREAVQINLTTHITATEFRQRQRIQYGLEKEDLNLGIIHHDYNDIREPWTGSYFVANNLKRLVDLSCQWVEAREESGSKPKGANKPDLRVLDRIRSDLPTLIDVMLTSVLEHARFMAAQKSAKDQTAAQDFMNIYHTYRYERSVALAQWGQREQAAMIAERHGSLSGLAAILIDHIATLEAELLEPDLDPMDLQTLKTVRASKKTEVERCLGVYGEAFAFALYDYLLDKHGIQAVLEFDLDKLGFKTKYLRSRPDLAKISWIHDIQHEKDLGHAAETLLNIALHKEQQVWNKKVQLSLGKLALLAEAEEKESTQPALIVKYDDVQRDEALHEISKEVVAIKIRDELYAQIAPSTWEAVDEAAALNFALEAHGKNIPRRRKVVSQIFEDGMKRLLRHEVLDAMTLIELLTLIYLTPEARSQMMADPFWLALKIAAECCHKDEVTEAKKLVWRRLFTRDDWSKANDTQMKNDDEVTEVIMSTELYPMLLDCIRYQDAQRPFRPMKPKDALGAFTTELDRRFRGFDSDFQAKLRDAMKAEDKLLSQSIEKHRLGEWVGFAFKAAKTEVEHEVDMATRNGSLLIEDAAVNDDASSSLPTQGASFFGGT
jgi:nuclear pore complex protein Nup133